MKYSLPYTPELSDFLHEKDDKYISAINDLYFSDEKYNPSARYIPDVDTGSMWSELRDIQQSHDIKMHYVMNSSVWKNDIYTTGKKQLIDNVNSIYESGCKILTINNMMLLRDVEFRNSIPKDLVLKLSINNKVSTLEEVVFLYEYNAIRNFILDRSVNRNMEELTRIHEWRSDKPGVTLTLLAQEGCISRCPWKATCDNMIATFHQYDEHEVNDMKAQHSTHFCTAHYTNHPQDMLKSPWITPGGVRLYENMVDYIKLAGRMQPIGPLSKTFDAYINQDERIDLSDILTIHSGSVLSISTVMDLEINGYSAKVSNCKNKCADCDFCDKLYNKLYDENR